MAQENVFDGFDISAFDTLLDALEFNTYSSLFLALDEYLRSLPLEATLQKRIYTLIASACSMKLVANNNECIFKPYMIIEERRSAIPSDFSNEEKTFFSDCIAEIKNYWVKARFADILWVANRPRDYNNAKIAAENYLQIFERSTIWSDETRKILQRAVQLYKGVSNSKGIDQIEELLANNLAEISVTNAKRCLDLSEIIKESIPKRNLLSIAARKCAILGDEFFENGNTFNARAFYSKSSELHKQLNDMDEFALMTIKAARCYELDAKRSILNESQGYLVAAHFYEYALQTYRGVPNKFRKRNQIDEKIDELQVLLREAGEYGLNEMALVSSPPMDISDIVQSAKNAVTGKDIIDALFQFVLLSPTPDLKVLRENVIQSINESPINKLFGSSSLADDGRVIAKRPVLGASQEADETVIFMEMTQNYILNVDFSVKGLILPALNEIRNEHTMSETDFRAIVYSSPFVPSDRTDIVALGLYHGFCGDFASSIHILAPQIENIVRYHLRMRNEKTSKIDDNGIETENSMSTLMKNDKISQIFGEGLAFELKCLFTEAHGANLRNQSAHGLMTYEDCNSSSSIYSWWLILKVIYNTYISALTASANNKQSV